MGELEITQDSGEVVTECLLLGGPDEFVTKQDAALICSAYGASLVELSDGSEPMVNNFIKILIHDASDEGAWLILDQGLTPSGGLGPPAQGNTIPTIMVIGPGTCLGKSGNCLTGCKMNPTTMKLKTASPLYPTTTVLDLTTSIGTTSLVMILPDSFA